MAPRNRVQSETDGPVQAPDDNIKKRRVSARTSSRTRMRRSDRPNEAETSRVEQIKTRRPNWGRVVGRLAGLMDMPMDILFEIFGHLMPLDVLRLARTTKQFRRMLMHRSSVSIWIAARKNVSNLPSCPPYLSEPQFANLVFDTHCHECLSPNIRSVDWRIGRRICSRCLKEYMVEDYSHHIGDSVYKSVPCKYGKRGRPSYYSKDLQEFQSKRVSLTDPEERNKFVKERQALVIQMEKHGALLEEWATNQVKDRLEQLDDLRRERKEAIIEKLTELGWGPEIKQIPYRDDLSHHRLVKRPTRLTPRIWENIRTEMVGYMQLMRTQRLERERKALVISRKRITVSILRAYKVLHLPFTDAMPEPVDFCAIPQVLEILELPTEVQVTEDTFSPVVEKMDELVGEWRSGILKLLVQKVKDSLYSHRPRIDRHSEPVDSSLADNASNSSSADLMSKGKAKVIEPSIEPSIPDDAQVVQGLSLATTVFNCKRCNPRSGTSYGLCGVDFDPDADPAPSEDDYFDRWSIGLGPRTLRLSSNPLFFPKVLGHHCLTKQHGIIWDDPNGDPTKQYDYPLGNRTRWGCHLLQVDEKAGQMAANVVRTCGLDPETTTTIGMDELNGQLACPECLDWSDEEWNKADASVFGWRAAVAHNCRFHPGTTNIEWILIADEDLEDIVNLEESGGNQSNIAEHLLSIHGLGTNEEVAWLCAHCLDLPNESEAMQLSSVKSHLNQVHSISEPQENQDYYRDYEDPQGRKTRIPRRQITLTLPRPDNIPGPGERHCFDPWCWFSDEEFEDDYFSDDVFF